MNKYISHISEEFNLLLDEIVPNDADKAKRGFDLGDLLDIDWECHKKCAKFHWCRLKTLAQIFGKCHRPSGCVCHKFDWED